jgi:3-oxoacyl-(acyl-carrier-protein) synthase
VTELLTTDLVVLARGEWSGPGVELPRIAGFVVSAFSPLVAEAAERCLVAYREAPSAATGLDNRADTGVVLASVRGDTTTTDAVTEALRDGRRVPPLLFFQSNPNAVVGYVTSRWGLTGPVVCVSPAGDPVTDAFAVAELMLADGAATQVLVVVADLAADVNDTDHAVALLVGQTRR